MNDQQYKEPENPYEFEKDLKSTGKVKATGIVTTALIIAGGLLGGAAFAVNAQGNASSVAPGVNQNVVDTGSSSVSQTDSSSSAPTASDSAQPVPVDAGSAPVSGNSGNSSKPNSAPAQVTAPASSPSATPAPTESSTPKTIAVPPTVSFGGGDDGNGDHHDGKHKRDANGANSGSTGKPSFGNGDDNGGGDD